VITKTFALDGPINLEVRLTSGSVTVDAVDGLTEAYVEAVPRHENSDVLDHLVVELDGPTLLVRSPRQGGVFDLPIFGRRGRDEIDLRVRVPSGTALHLLTFTASLAAHGRIGGADVAFGSADALFEHVGGDLRVRFGNGTVRAVQVNGSVELRSGSGSIDLGEVGGAISAGCGSGSLDVHVAHDAVRSRSGSGNARIGAAHGDVDVVSGSGNVQIGLPAGVTARLDVTSGAGRVESELPIEDAPRPTTARTISLRARTGSGRVRLFRAA
jgi:hypothetical protein